MSKSGFNFSAIYIGIYSKSNVTTGHKNVKHETLCC